MSKQTSAIAGAVGLVLATIATAIGLNVGILGASSDESASGPDSTTTTAQPSTVPPSTTTTTTSTTVPTGPRIVTLYVDETVPGGAAPASPAGAPASSPQPPADPAASGPTGGGSSEGSSGSAHRASPATPAPTTPAPTATSPPSGATSYPVYKVPGIGTVTLQRGDGQIHFWAASTTANWQYEVEDDGPRKVEVKFRAGGSDEDEEDEQEAKFEAELENGQIRTRVEADD